MEILSAQWPTYEGREAGKEVGEEQGTGGREGVGMPGKGEGREQGEEGWEGHGRKVRTPHHSFDQSINQSINQPRNF